MAALFRLPFDPFFLTGQLLAFGSVSFCEPGTLTLATVFTDDGLTTPAQNPATLDSVGQIEQGAIYLGAQDYRVIVKNASGTVVPNGDIDPIHGDDGSTFSPTATGGVRHPIATSRNEFLNVFDFLTNAQITQVQANGVTNDLSTNLQKAADTGKPLDWPAGKYACNIALPKIRMRGAGSTTTIIVPFDTAIAAFTYRDAMADWTYHTVLEGFQFLGTSKVGIGFTFSRTAPTDYVAGDENAGRVTFNNCDFENLNKGVQCPFGNIGVYFNKCGFSGNYYGSYALNNKFGSAMHAGNKYFQSCEFHNNTVARYFHNTADGFYGPVCENVIDEGNIVNEYVYNDCGANFIAVTHKSHGNEASGQLRSGGAPATVTLDTWSGSTKGTQDLTPHSFIFDGANGSALFSDSGLMTDIYLKATAGTIDITDSRFESASGFSGAPCVVDHPTTARIRFINPCFTEGGIQAIGTIADGIITQANPDINQSGSGAVGRASLIPARMASIDRSDLIGVSLILDSATDFGGSKTLSGSQVSDGSFATHANSYSDTLTNAQLCSLSGSNPALSAGFWVVTVDIKVTVGAPVFQEWDQSTNQFFVVRPPADGLWHTYGGIGQVVSGTPTTLFGVTGSTGSAVTQTFRLRNYQKWKFTSQAEAQDFLASKVYAT